MNGAQNPKLRLASIVLALVAGLGGALLLAQDHTVGRLIVAGPCMLRGGSGTPEAAVTGNVCDLFARTNGGAGTTLYVKESGTGNTGWVAPATLDSTTTFTNKTLNAESTGNVVTLPLVEWYPAAVCQNATAVTAWSTPVPPAAPAAACITGTNTQRGVLDYDDAADENAQLSLRLPADFTGAIDATIFWQSTATSGNVVWQVQTICVADAETGDPAYNTASTVTDATKGTTNQVNTAALTGITATGCAAGELLFFKVRRDPANGSDTLGATARFIGVEVVTRRGI